MSEQYFSDKPLSKQDVREFSAELAGRQFRFRTDAGVFSKDDVDPGSRLLISVLPCRPGDRVLDVGCGYGPIGIAAAWLVAPTGTVLMVDVNPRAAALARHNLQMNGLTNAEVFVSDGLEGVPGVGVDWVVINPPIRAGKVVVRRLVAEAMARLRPDGAMLMVIRTKQGAKSMETYLDERYGRTTVLKKDGGFRVLQTVKSHESATKA